MIAPTDMSDWFHEDELEPCPACGETKLVPGTTAGALRVCLACGIVPRPPPRPAP